MREFGKRSRHFYLGDHFINSQTLPVDSLWILLGENWSWWLVGLKGLSDGPDKKESTNHNEHIGMQKSANFTIVSSPASTCMITSSEPYTEAHKMNRNPPITNHKLWTFELIKVNSCFLRGPQRWLTEAKNTNISWLLNFRVCMFLKRAVPFQWAQWLEPSQGQSWWTPTQCPRVCTPLVPE